MGRLDSLHEETVAALATAEELLDICQSSGDSADVEDHRAAMRRVFRLWDGYLAESERVMSITESRRDGGA